MTPSPEQRWLDRARAAKRCPECDAPVRDRSYPSSYCSHWCVDRAWQRMMREERR